jgi:general secretion pathway protein L
MTAREGFIVTLPDTADGQPLWMRVIDDTVVQGGSGTHWLDACGLAALPDYCSVMLVPPAGLTTLHWISNIDMPVRQGRAAARLAALSDSIDPPETLLAAANENDDPASPHIVAIAARADMQHWLLWAQHNGLDPDAVVPAALLLPEPDGDGYVMGTVGGVSLLRGRETALPADEPMAEVLVGGSPVAVLSPEAVSRAAISMLASPVLNMRQGDFAKRARRPLDRQQLVRIAVWTGFIALASLLISLAAIVRYNSAASTLDGESLALAATVLPEATDPERIGSDLDARLAARGAGAYTFTGPVAGLFTAMQRADSVSLTKLGRSADGMVTATLASAQAKDINIVLLALQDAGFTITATSSQDSGGRVLADITVKP